MDAPTVQYADLCPGCPFNIRGLIIITHGIYIYSALTLILLTHIFTFLLEVVYFIIDCAYNFKWGISWPVALLHFLKLPFAGCSLGLHFIYSFFGILSSIWTKLWLVRSHLICMNFAFKCLEVFLSQWVQILPSFKGLWSFFVINLVFFSFQKQGVSVTSFSL